MFKILTIALILFVSNFSFAAPILLDDSSDKYVLADSDLYYFRESASRFDIKMAKEEFHQGGFRKLDGNLGLGFTKDIVWLAFEVRKPFSTATEWMLRVEPPTLDNVQVFLVDKEGQQKYISGDSLPMSNRAHKARNAIFPLSFDQGNSLVLVRIQTTSQMTAVPILYKKNAYSDLVTTETMLFGVFYGLLFSIVIYSLIFAIKDRNALQIQYALYVFFLSFFWFTFDGSLALYFLPESPLLVNLALAAFLVPTSSFGIYLYSKMLRVNQDDKVSRWILNICYLIGAIGVISIPLGQFKLLLPLLLGSYVLSLPVLLRYAVKRTFGDSIHERIFGGSYILFGISVVITMLANLGVLEANIWTLYAGQLSHLVHAIALHLGLVMRDRALITEKNNLESKLSWTEWEAEKERLVRARQDEFLQMVGHEVRTPLSVINSSVDSMRLLQAETNDPLLLKRFERIQQAVRRMEQLIKVVNNDSEISSELANIQNTQSVNFTSSVHEVLELNSDLLSRIDLISSIDPSSMAGCDEGMLKIVLSGLLDNSRKYSPPESPVFIRLYSKVKDGVKGFAFAISNRTTHSLIGQEERIFEKYFRVKSDSSVPGFGFGLYLARKVVSRFSGTLTVRVPDPNSITFTLWLPESPRLNP